MKKKKSDENMYKSIKVYRIFTNANIVSILSKKQTTSIFKQYIFILLPIIFCLGDWFFMAVNNTLYSSNKKIYSYIDDLSDSFGLTILFLVSYFLSGYYQRKVDEFLEYGIDRKCKNKIEKIRIGTLGKMFSIICLFIGLLIGTLFFTIKVENNNIYWLSEINIYAKIYHGLLLGITWYNSLTILGMATAAGFIVYWSIESGKLHYVENFYNKNTSIIKAFDILACTLSYGLFYILGSVLIILNDNIAKRKYSIEGIFDKPSLSIILIVFVLCIVILEIIPLIKLWRYMKEKKNNRIRYLNDNIEKMDIFNKKHIYFYRLYHRNEKIIYRDKMFKEMEEISCHGVFNDIIKSRILLFSSFVIPLTGVVIQAINVLIKYNN